MALPIDGGALVVALLVAESVLIALTIVLIVLSRREARQRVDLLDQLVTTAEVLTRREYFTTSVEALQGAETTVEGMITGAPPDDHAAPVDRILETVRRAADRGVRVRYLLPTGRERLEMGHRYHEAGAEIRYHPGLLAGDARFMVVDDRIVVIGFPEHPGDEEPTRRGQRIYSEKVARLFAEDFEEKWTAEETMTLDRYLHRVVSDIVGSHPRTSSRRIADELDLPRERVQACLDEVARREAVA